MTSKSADFPALPKGYRWTVEFNIWGGRPEFVAKIKGRFRTHAEGYGFPEYGGGPESAARAAYRRFQTKGQMSPREAQAKEYEAELNTKAHT